MIVTYAVVLDLPGAEALEDADRRIADLANELDPQTAYVKRGDPTDIRPAYRAAGLLHGGEPRTTRRAT